MGLGRLRARLLAPAEERAFERDVALAWEDAERRAGHLGALLEQHLGWDAHLSRLPLGSELAGAGPDVQRAASLLAQRLVTRQRTSWDTTGARAVTVAQARKALGWTPAEVAALFDTVLSSPAHRFVDTLRLPLAAAERLSPVERAPVEERLRALHRRLAEDDDGWSSPAEHAKLTRRLAALLVDDSEGRGPGPRRLNPALLNDGDGWRQRLPGPALDRVADGDAAALLEHAATLEAVRPTAAWSRRAGDLVGRTPDAGPLVHDLLAALPSVPLSTRHARDQEGWYLTGPDEALARGLVWVLALDQGDAASRLLGEVALHAGLDPSGGGVVRLPKVATSAVAALGRREDDASVAGLARLRARVRFKTLVKAVDAALDEVAARRGTGREELLELTVPHHGLDERGEVREQAGAHAVVVAVRPPGDVALTVVGPSGAALRSVPAVLRSEHADVLARQRAVLKEVRATAATERSRLEGLLAVERSWPVARWRRHYRDHPVTGAVADGLLWSVEGRTGLARGATLLDLAGAELRAGEDDAVQLWHPMTAQAGEVRAWRERLADGALRQPFKQAFREVYLLTPAERETGTYSNRFAGHVLEHRVFGGLLRARRWQGNHLGWWDGGYEGEARRVLTPDWRAVLFYEVTGADDGAAEDGVVALCTTDQVRFERRDPAGGWDQAPLDQVPARVFSEAMRDVDLFVGVSSVAADPTWVDRGADRHLEYWTSAAFGEVTESAAVRRDALRALLPRTTIADRVSVGDRFLTVRGDLRTYKIHLGSANILMEPDDSYLCIVPGRDRADRVFLPFEEGGGRLSVIVSKAFLLAADTAITDPSIVGQIRRR